MGWRETIFDPWKVPAYLAGAALVGFITLLTYEARDRCGISCKLDQIEASLDRIDKKLDEANRRMQIGKCDLDDPLGTNPLQRKASFQ